MGSDRYRKIYEFASKYYDLYASKETSVIQLEDEEFAKDCLDLGFNIDGTEAFERKHRCATVSTEVMKAACRGETDIDLLGSAIFSQWRYFTHWSQRDLTDSDIREWFKTGFIRLLELATFPVFEGVVEKIVIESEVGGFFIPPIGSEISQRITMHRDGRIALIRYYIGPDIDENNNKKMNRYKNKPTSEVMDYIADYCREYHEQIKVCDAGIWDMKITNSDGDEFWYDGPLVDDIEVHFVKISVFARKILGIEDLWMFDGGEYEEEE